MKNTEITLKICFKCSIEKELKDYYKHRGMADGHLGKCIKCTKSDSKRRELELRKDNDWIELENKRQREKYHRLGYRGLHKPTKSKQKEINAKYNKKYPEKKIVRNLTTELKPLVKGNQLHHWSYNKKDAKDVIELNIKDHNKIHRYMKYDTKTFYYKDLEGFLLDTKPKHINYIKSII